MTSERELTAPAPTVVRARPTPKTGLVGVPELIALSLSALLLVAAVFAYFYLLVPARTRLHTQETTRTDLERSIRNLNVQVGNHDSAQGRVRELSTSLLDFEQNALTPRATGRTELITRLNELMRQNNLRNTAGPTYLAMEQLDPNAPTANRPKTGDARFQTFYPGTAVNVTVEGGYASVRRFIHDVEAMPQFVIVNTVELEDVAGNNSSAPASPVGEQRVLTPRLPAQPAAPSSGAAPGGVSLRLGLTVYYRREGNGGTVGN